MADVKDGGARKARTISKRKVEAQNKNGKRILNSKQPNMKSLICIPELGKPRSNSRNMIDGEALDCPKFLCIASQPPFI
jgi:hypothetical protein